MGPMLLPGCGWRLWIFWAALHTVQNMSDEIATAMLRARLLLARSCAEIVIAGIGHRGHRTHRKSSVLMTPMAPIPSQGCGRRAR
jgi:hypothetical protein